MNTIPDLSELGVSPETFNLEGQLEVIGKGFNSRVASAGNLVLKVSKASYEPEAAAELAATMQAENRTIAEFVGENIPATMYVIADSANEPHKAKVVTVQEWKDGLHLLDYLALPEDERDTAPLIDFLYRSIEVYRAYKVVPDLANIETMFNMFKSKNVRINPTGKDAHVPFLVDTNFGKTQRSRQLGPLWTKGIVWGVKRGIRKLEAA